MKRMRMRGARYSGKKFLNILPLTPPLIHYAIGFMRSKSYRKLVRETPTYSQWCDKDDAKNEEA